MIKRIRYYLLVVIGLLILSSPAVGEGKVMDGFIKGKAIGYESLWKDGERTLVDLDRLVEELGLEKEELKERSFKLHRDGKSMELTLDTHRALGNGREITLSTEPLSRDGLIYVPIRDIAEFFGEEVIWDGKNKIVIVGEFEEEVNLEDTYLYYNKEHGYTLNFPESWKERALIEAKDGNLYIHDKKTYDKFREDGYDGSGPVVEIRASDYPVLAGLAYEGDKLLAYEDGKYIEAIFDSDNQFYEETMDSYSKMKGEIEGILGSFKLLNEDETVMGDRIIDYKEIGKDTSDEKPSSYERVLKDIINGFLPEGVFKLEDLSIRENPINKDRRLYLSIPKSEDEVAISLTCKVDEEGRLKEYRLKNYGYDLKSNHLDQKEALELANRFVNRFLDGDMEVIKIPDLYPSLYEEDVHETYGDIEGKYLLVVDLEHGLIELFKSRDE